LAKLGAFEVNLIPSSSWGRSIANLARGWVGWGEERLRVEPALTERFREVWRLIRERELRRAEWRCEICGARGRLEVHELWDYDEEECVQRLKGYVVLCSPCHEVHHLGRSLATGRLEAAIDHMVRVNRAKGFNVSPHEVNKFIEEAFKEWRLRSQKAWRIDVSPEPLLGDLANIANDLLNGRAGGKHR